MGPPDGGQRRTVQLSLQAGESRVVQADSQVLAVEVSGASGARTYRVAVQNAARSPGATPLRLVTETGQSAAGAVGASGALGAGGFGGPSSGWRLSTPPTGDPAAEIRLRAFDYLVRNGIRPARSSGPPVSRSSMLPNEAPSTGDSLKFWVGVQEDLTIECDTDSADVVTGVVEATGSRAIVVADADISESTRDQMDFPALRDDLDDAVFEMPAAYFGEPTDIDSNGHVYMLFTAEVNRLSGDDDSESRVTGFFLPTDLAESGDPDKDGSDASTCAAGNEAEVLYLIAPDPDGRWGDTVSVGNSDRLARSVGAHELQHLINTGNRVIKQGASFNNTAATWLDEGLSHIAEEVTGLGQAGLGVRRNLTIEELVDSQEDVDIFNRFHIENFLRLRRYFLDPAGTRALAVSDPGGVESLEMRGFAWIFLRWVADQVAPSGDGALPGAREDELFRKLARGSGGLHAGLENLEAATGRSWDDLVGEFAAMAAVDDTANTDERHQLLTWDLRDIFLALHENEGTKETFEQPYPLAVTERGFTADTFDFDLEGGGVEHFTFSSSGSAPALTFVLSDQTGNPVPAGAVGQITVVRTR